jgi:microcystin-dependent protein
MAGTPTPRLNLPIPDENMPPDVPLDIGRLATAIDLVASGFGQGTLAQRPPQPQARGLLYYAQDNLTIYWSDGANWLLAGGPATNFSAGDIILSGASGKAGWLICNGAIVSRTTYAGLFTAIGSSFGDGDGSTSFGLPDLRGRVPIGTGAGAGLNVTLGAMAGEAAHALSLAEIPSHNHGGATGTGTSGTDSPDHAHSGTTAGDYPDHAHGIPDSGHAHAVGNLSNGSSRVVIWTSGSQGSYWVAPGTGSQGTDTRATGITGTYGANARHQHDFGTGGASARHAHSVPALAIAAAGGGAAHNVVQPYVGVNYWIKT